MTQCKTVGPAAVVAFFGVSAVVCCVFEELGYHTDEKSYSARGRVMNAILNSY